MAEQMALYPYENADTAYLAAHTFSLVNIFSSTALIVRQSLWTSKLRWYET